MLVSPIALVVVVTVAGSGRQGAASDPMLDPEIWGFGGIGGPEPSGARSPPEPIVPERWSIVPCAPGVEAASVLARWILDPAASAPIAVEDPAGVDVAAGRWLARRTPDLDGAACAFTAVHSDVAEVRMARLTGGCWMLVNGELAIGDVDCRGYRGVPVALRAGENRIFVVADGSTFEFELWKPATRLVIEAFDVGWGGEDVTYPIFNASSDATAEVHVHYGHAVKWSRNCKPSLTDWRDGGYISPLGMQLGASYYDTLVEECGFGIGRSDRDVFVPICVYAHEGELADRRLLHRKADEKGLVGNSLETIDRRPRDYGETLVGLYPLNAVHVYGTRGKPQENSAALAAARFDQQFSWYHRGDVPFVVSDVDYLAAVDGPRRGWLSARAREGTIVLRGNADTNAAWSRFVAEGSVIDARRGRVRIVGEEHVGEDLLGWISLRVEHEEVLVRFDSGAAGARLAGCLATQWHSTSEPRALFRAGDTPSGRLVRIRERPPR